MRTDDVATGSRPVDLAAIVGVHDVERLRHRDAEEARDLVALEERLDVAIEREVGQAIGVVGEEHLVVAEVALHPAQPLADVRLVAGVDERDLPLVDVGASISTCRPPSASTKSFVAHSSYSRKNSLILCAP